MSNKLPVFTNYILLYLSLAIFIMPIRLLGIFNTAYLVLALSFGVSILISFWFLFAQKEKNLSYIEVFICFFPFLLIPVALVNGHSLNYVITDTLKPMLWILIIGFFKNAKINDDLYIRAIKNNILILTFCSLTTVLYVNYIIMTVGGIRPSASDIAMLLPFFYFFVNKQYLLFTAFFIMLIMGGKIGPLLSILIVFILFFLVRVNLKTIALGMSIIFLVFIASLNFNYAQWHQFLPILSKFHLIFEGNFSAHELDSIDKYMLGGRLAEVFSSMSVYKDNLFLLFTGPGVGYTYDLYRDGMLEEENRHGVHLSPISFLTIYGAFYTLVFYSYLSYLFFKSLIIMKKNKTKFQVMAAMFFIANLINSFTVFSIFSVLLFPLSIGLLLNKSKPL